MVPNRKTDRAGTQAMPAIHESKAPCLVLEI
jgi:hypothetical protein